jgi:hypothetical protein
LVATASKRTQAGTANTLKGLRALFLCLRASCAAAALQVFTALAETEGKTGLSTMRHLVLSLSLIVVSSTLAGCDALGVESATQINAKREAEARAIGSACRYALRGIEDCFAGNNRAGKASVFEGWKEMDQYMRDNQMVGMPADSGTVKPKASDEPSVTPDTARTEASTNRS